MRRIRADKQIQTAVGLAYLLKSDGSGEFQNFAPGVDGEVLTVTAAGDLIYRMPVTIGAASSNFMTYNATTGELNMTSLGITNVSTSTEPNVAGVIANEYTAGTEFQEGDTVIIPADGTVYIHNGGTVGDITDFTQITAPSTSGTAIRALFSGINGVSYNVTTGEFTGVVDPNVLNDITVSGTGFFVDVSESDVTDTQNLVAGSTGGTTTVTLQDLLDALAAIEHPDITTGTTFPSSILPKGAEFILLDASGNTIGSYVSDGATLINTSLIHPTVNEGTILPIFDVAAHMLGTEFIVQDGVGDPVTSYVSDGTKWIVTSQTSGELLPITAVAGDYLYYDGTNWVKATKVEEEFTPAAASTTVTLSGTPITALKVVGYSNGIREGVLGADVVGTTWTLPFVANGVDQFEAVYYTV